MPLTLAVAYANVYGGCIVMACRDAVVQLYQFGIYTVTTVSLMLAPAKSKGNS